MSRKRTIKQQLSQIDSEDVPRKRSKSVKNKENASQNVVVDIDAYSQTASVSQRKIILPNMRDDLAALRKSGQIKKISLKNFMCHANFEVQMNRAVNIFVGLNGSGKSAILTALSIGLGSKATATARSTNLKDLVRRGESFASIEITLSNDGSDAYDVETYGHEITIVRHINANSGASAYKIKSQNGRVISTSRQDLMKLASYLNIQVENPVFILNQDAARSFLKDCDPKKLYAFFMKATQIESIIEKLNSCIQATVSSKNRLETVGKSIEQGETEVLALREKHNRLQSVAQLREKIEEMLNEIEWLAVINVEKEIASENQKLTKVQIELKKIEDFVNNKAKYEKELKEKIREFGTDFVAREKEINEKGTAFKNAQQVYETERDKFSAAENKVQEIEKKLKSICTNITQLEKDIFDHDNNPANVENVRRENEQKIIELEERRRNTHGMMDNAKRDYGMFFETLNDTKERLEEMLKKIKRENDTTNQIDRNIQQFKSAGKDRMAAYGVSMTALLRDIETLSGRQKFSAKPRGPIGSFIEVPDPKYRQAVENILGPILRSFVVNSDADRILLKQTIQKYNDLKGISIITCQFQNKVYDYRKGMVRMEDDTGVALVNVIKVSDPIAMNCLIDQKQIERIVIVDNTDKAIHLTQEEENVPMNLMKVILLNPFSEYYPAPNYRSYSLTLKPNRYINTNKDDLIKNAEAQKLVVKEKCKALTAEKNRIQDEINKRNQAVNEKKKLMNELQQQLTRISREIAELKAVEYPEEQDIEFKRNLLKEQQEQKLKIDEKVGPFKKKLGVLKEIAEIRKQEMKNLEAEHLAIRAEMAKIQAQIEVTKIELQGMTNDVATKTNQIAFVKIEENDIRTKVHVLQQNLQQLQVKARSGRVECNRSEFEIKESIRGIERRILRIESAHENINDVALLLENKDQYVADTKQIHASLDFALKQLEKVRDSRYSYIRRLRSHMILRVRHKFRDLMSLKTFTGDVIFDKQARELELKVIPRDAEIEGAVSNTKSLSGGERSYSTVAFLIALWSCVDHPFYFLDEYDVFSDEYNRHIMTQLLLNEAAKKAEKQFGFLTPQDFSNIQATKTITIHKLQDPDRMN